MDERAKIPVTLPLQNPSESYWQQVSAKLTEDTNTSDLPGSLVDVAIIGSGITGASIAWHMLRPTEAKEEVSRVEAVLRSTQHQPKVVMLEARNACSGATGRNGGHTKAASYRSFLENQTKVGVKDAVKIACLELENINAMHAWAKTGPDPSGQDVESHPCTTLDVIYDEGRWAQAHEAVAAMRETLGPDHPAVQYTFHDANEVRDKFYVAGTDPRPVGGVSYAAGSISSYKYTIRMLSELQVLGLSLHTNTPVSKIVRLASNEWMVQTPRGRLRAKQVVLATNGYTAHLWEPFQGAVVPLRGQVTAQVPGKSMPTYLPGTYSFIYEHGYEYMIQRQSGHAGLENYENDLREFMPQGPHDGDIIIGGGHTKAPHGGLLEYGTTDDTTLEKTISEYLSNTTVKYFGDSWGEERYPQEGRVKKEWTGIMGYSSDGFPFVGPVPGQVGLWTSCAFQGHGMALAWMCAKALVQMIREQVDPGVDESTKQAARENLDIWFPAAFKTSEERIQRRL